MESLFVKPAADLPLQDLTPPHSPTVKPELILTVDRVNELYEPLRNAAIGSVAALEKWIDAWGTVEVLLEETCDRLQVACYCDTKDQAQRQKLEFFLEKVKPEAEKLSEALRRKYTVCPFRAELPKDRYEVFERQVSNFGRLYCEKNLSLLGQEEQASSKYREFTGSLTVDTPQGKCTIPRSVPQFLAAGRPMREELWRKVWQARLEIAPDLDDLFDQLLVLRGEIATNLGFSNFRDYAFQKLQRFDYSPADCENFAASVEKIMVPLARSIYDEHRKELGLEALRPWDLSITRFYENLVPTKGQKPRIPAKDVGELLLKTENVLARIDPSMAAQLREMKERGELDLESREGKSHGGFCASYNYSGRPFIFTNAAGTASDQRMLVHEFGHAFHTIQCRDAAPFYRQHIPTEFNEVASISMEMLAWNYFEEYYGQEARAAKRAYLRDPILFFPYVAQVDLFQQWIYTHPKHSATDRQAKWAELTKRFGPPIDWSGLEHYRDIQWHQQSHIFENPFYYIEYAVAQLGALQLWLSYPKDPKGTVSSYRNALTLGGAKPLPELFAAAGIKFDFSERTLVPVVEKLTDEYNRLAS